MEGQKRTRVAELEQEIVERQNEIKKIRRAARIKLDQRLKKLTEKGELKIIDIFSDKGLHVGSCASLCIKMPTVKGQRIFTGICCQMGISHFFVIELRDTSAALINGQKRRPLNSDTVTDQVISWCRLSDQILDAYNSYLEEIQ